MRLRYVRSLALLLPIIALAGCGGGGSTGGTGGATLRMGTIGMTGALNPFGGLQAEYATFANVYPRLVKEDPTTLAHQPSLATSWRVSEGGRVWTFRLRGNAKWSDGSPLTARDVAFTFNTIVKYSHGPTANYSEYVTFLQSATATDPATVVLRYSKPVATVLSQAGGLLILPEHVWGRYATGDGKALKTFTNLPAGGHPVVSGGPFMITQQKTNAFEAFERNPHFFGTRPTIGGFGIKYFGSPDDAVTALKTGDIDVLIGGRSLASGGVPATAAQALQSAGFQVATPGAIDFDGLLINPSAGKQGHRELLDPAVRKAFEYALDRSSVVRVVYSGLARPGSTIVPPAIGKWHDSQIAPLAFDPAKANQLLDGAGFGRGPGGVRTAKGHPMAYEVLIQPSQEREFEIIKAGFDKIGVSLTARALDTKAQFRAISGSDMKYGGYDLALRTWTSGGYDPDFGLSGFTCFSRGLYNPSGYCDPAYDKLYAEQKVAPERQRVSLVDQMQKLVYASRAFVVISYPDHLDAWSKRWNGFVETTNGLFSILSAVTLTSAHRSG